MAYYRMSGSSKGELHGASVLVTVQGDSVLAGETVTLTKSGFSQTKTLSASKTCLFTDILEKGTYTATYKTFTSTVSISADDVLLKTTKNITIELTVQISLTVEGAKEDNITIYDTNGTVVDTLPFGSGQTTGTIELAIPSEGVTYKFESSVAKDTETGTENYSKNVNLTNTSSSVKVMPDNSLYWYGNNLVSFVSTTISKTGWTNVPSGVSLDDMRLNPNNSTNYPPYYCAIKVSESCDFSVYSKIKMHGTYNSTSGSSNDIFLSYKGSTDTGECGYYSDSTSVTNKDVFIDFDISSITETNNVHVIVVRKMNLKINALVLE